MGHNIIKDSFHLQGLAQLAVKASGEAWRGMLEAYRAPIKLWTDTLRPDNNGQRHALQTVSLCGRKVRIWSDIVKVFTESLKLLTKNIRQTI